MKTTKIRKGVYKVEVGNTIVVIKDMSNPLEVLSPFKGWEAWTSNNSLEVNDSLCWACGAPNKKTLLAWIKQDFDKGLIA